MILQKKFSYKRRMTNRIVLSEIENRLHRLDKRVKKDEKSGLLDGKEKVKRHPSEYNLFIAEELKKIKRGTPQ